MFEKFRSFEYNLAGKPLVIETGKMAGLANGSCLVKLGDTTVLATATASAKPREGIDFLPLSVDFEARLYAAGKIPGSYNKREGRPTDKSILSSRVIDRPIRPLFPKDLRNDVAINLLILSVDPDCEPEVAAMLGASIALSISDIPWNGPIAGVHVGLIGDEIIINPDFKQREKSTLELTVAGSHKKVVMIEAGVGQEIIDGLRARGHELIVTDDFIEEIKKLCAFIDTIVKEVGKPKFEYPSCELDHDMFDKVFAFCEKDLMFALDTDDKNVRDERVEPIKDAITKKFSEEYPEIADIMEELMYKLQKKL